MYKRQALVLIGGFGWNTPVAEKVMPMIKSAIEQEKVIGAICNAASFMAKSVSYTHLDVYKRQVIYWLCVRLLLNVRCNFCTKVT